MSIGRCQIELHSVADWGAGGLERVSGRRQEKGNAETALLCLCLHIVFSRDGRVELRVSALKIGGNLAFIARNREAPAQIGGRP